MKNFFRKINFKINLFFEEVIDSAVFLLKMPEWLFGPKLRIGLVIINVFIIIAFVLQVATTSSTGYELKKLEKITEELAKEQQKIEAEITTASSLATVSQKIQNSTMVNVSRFKYFEPAASLVAVNTQ